MLIRFNIKNFLSFSETEKNKSEEFSMIAGKVRSKREHLYDDGNIKLLKLAAIYGANASGKSNFVKALKFMQHIIVEGFPEGYSEKYCKTDDDNRDKPSYFEVEIKIKDRYYAYGFEIILNEGKFISEWLIELLANGSEKEIFTRDISKGEYSFGKEIRSDDAIKKLEVYIDDIKSDSEALFLSVMNENKKNLYTEFENIKMIQDTYMWFGNTLDINYPDRPISDYSYMANTENVEKICKFIAAFGTGIRGFKMVDVPLEKILGEISNEIRKELLAEIEEKLVTIKKFKKGIGLNSGIIMRSNKDFFILDIDEDKDESIICKTIKFEHENKNTLFDMSEESDGTIRILDLIEVLLSDNQKTYVIDELDRCLHPSLTYKFIETFLELAEKRNIQLIVTTHESRLLDFDLLRRDEIWFVNKRKTGESDMYSLEEYNTRFDKKIDKAYLEGRYGGTPIFDTIFPIGKEV